MRQVLKIALAIFALTASGEARADYTITQGLGTTISAFVCATTKVCPANVLIDSTGAEKATSANPLVDNITQWASGVLGAMANYGTSPGTVLVPGVNAFVTGAANFVAQAAALPTNIDVIGISDGTTNCSGGPCAVVPTGLASGPFGTPASTVMSVQANDPCTYAIKSSAAISVTSATTTSLVAVSGTTTVYVCGYSMTIAPSATSADTALFEYGIGGACTSPTALSGTYGNGDLTSAAPVTHVNYGNGGYTVVKSAGSAGICIVTTGTAVNVQGVLSYVQQ